MNEYLSREEKRDVRRTVFWGIGLGTAAVILVILIVGAISIALWAFGVFTSDIKGRGEALKIKNSAINRIQAQEWFEQTLQDFRGDLVKIKIAKQAVASADPATLPLRKTDLVGIQQICVQVAQDYNANSRKFTQRDFKSVGLPATLNPERCTA